MLARNRAMAGGREHWVITMMRKELRDGSAMLQNGERCMHGAKFFPQDHQCYKILDDFYEVWEREKALGFPSHFPALHAWEEMFPEHFSSFFDVSLRKQMKDILLSSGTNILLQNDPNLNEEVGGIPFLVQMFEAYWNHFWRICQTGMTLMLQK